MPRHKEIRTLEDLAETSIAKNIIFHSRRMKQFRSLKEVYRKYKTLQFMYTDHLFGKLVEIYDNSDTIPSDREFSQLMRFLFHGEKPENFDFRPCLEFIFNEFTRSIFPPSTNTATKKISEEILSYIKSQCVGLQTFSKNQYFLQSTSYIQAIPKWQNLVHLNLNYSDCCSDEILEEIFKNCIFLNCLELKFTPLTNKSMFFLCKHDFQSQTNYFCQESGTCSTVGKSIKKLDIEGTCITERGKACALLHLPLLQCFSDTSDIQHSVTPIFSRIPGAILTIQNTAFANGIALAPFQINEIAFGSFYSTEQMNRILEACPEVKSARLAATSASASFLVSGHLRKIREIHLFGSIDTVLSSSDFKQVLSVNHIDTLSLIGSWANMNVSYIHELLTGGSYLKSFTLLGYYVVDDQNISDYDDCFFSGIANLQELTLFCYPLHGDKIHYFLELLNTAKNIKILDIAGELIEGEMLFATERNDFYFLEKLRIQTGDTENIHLEKLITTENNLKNISFLNCRNQDTVAEKYKTLTQTYNYELQIDCN